MKIWQFLFLTLLCIFLGNNGLEATSKNNNSFESEGLSAKTARLQNLKKMAKKGSLDAMRNLALELIDEDENGKPDFNEAEKWLTKAAEKGCGHSAFVLAELYRRGEYPDGLVKNLEKAETYFKMSKSGPGPGVLRQEALEGSGSSANELGNTYWHGFTPFKQDVEEALKWYKKSVELGYAKGAESLARFYREGDPTRNKQPVSGFTSDLKKAREYEEKAALLGNFFKCVWVAYSYFRGENDYPKDWQKAEKFFSLALKQESKIHELSMILYNLAYICGNGGNGFSQNIPRARKLLKRLFAEGDEGYIKLGKKLLNNINRRPPSIRIKPKKMKQTEQKSEQIKPENTNSETATSQKNKQGFLVYCQKRTEDKLLQQMLAGDKSNEVGLIDSLEKISNDGNEVIIFYIPERLKTKLSEQTLLNLRKRKIIGIGYGAAQLFKILGLAINNGNCAHFTDDELPEMTWESDVILPKLKGSKFTVYSLAEIRKHAAQVADIALHLPRNHPLNDHINVIARLTDKPNYVSIARQGNHILVGFAKKPSTWQPGYRNLFAMMAREFQKQPDVSFSPVEHTIAKPGTYPFFLENCRSKEKRSSREFYFRFDSPRTFSATLEIFGSKNVMLLFMGENKELWTRENGEGDCVLDIKAKIGKNEIKSVGNGYWMLRIANFDNQNSAEGKLTISY